MKKWLHYRAWYTFVGSVWLGLSLSLVACGNDSSSGNDKNSNKDGVSEYESKEEMVHCTKSHYGEIAYVVETDSVYECTSKGWVVTDSSKIESLNSSDSKSNDEKSSSSEKTNKADTATVEKIKVDSVTVKGVAEKGPFTKGGVVTVYGLDSLFAKTKQTFKGSVIDDNGNYSVTGITLENQYALVEVNGFFKNEVTGKITSGTKTKLSALVDLSKGGTVKANVNILTPLEMSRAVYLVQNEKYNVPAAKKRATREILSAFGFSADTVAATELSLSDEGSSANNLFAASVALMGKLSLYKFNSRILDLSESFATTGKISDNLRAEIADQLSLLDSTGENSEIIKNIKSINSKATDVDEILYEFWYKEYGLPVCNDHNEKTQENNKNKLSENYGAGYACTSNHWHKSTPLDSELGLCVGDAEGSYKQSKTKKYYTCKSGQWREISSLQYELKECTDSIANDDSKKYRSVDDRKFFLCKDKQWEELSADEFELKDCTKDNDKDIVATKSENVYVCEDGSWRDASAQEEEFGYCSTVDSTKFKEMKDKYYVCLEDGWTEVDSLTAELGFCIKKDSSNFEKLGDNFYACLEDGWTKVSDVVAELGFCTDKTESFVVAKSGNVYACVENEWIKSSEMAMVIGEICDSENRGTFKTIVDEDFEHYACLDGDWVKCDMSINLFIDKNNAVVCDWLRWRKASDGEMATGRVCSGEDFCKVVSGYACDIKDLDFLWREASEAEKQTGLVCENSINNKVVGNYVCENSAWRKASEAESYTGYVCGETISVGKLALGSNNTYYSCIKENTSSFSWRKSNEAEIATKRVCFEDNLDSIAVKAGYTCVLENSNYKWRKSTAGELATVQICSAAIVDSVFTEQGFTCVDSSGKYSWRTATTAEQKTKQVCSESKNKYKVIQGYACDKTTGGFEWRLAKGYETNTGHVCEVSVELSDYYNYVCARNSSGVFEWRVTDEFEKYFGLCGGSHGGRQVGYLAYYYDYDHRYKCTSNNKWEAYTPVKENIGGTLYSVVEYAGLRWMAEDMRNAPSTGNYYCYDDATSCTTRLYDRSAAEKVCPAASGWRLAGIEDWSILDCELSYYFESYTKYKNDGYGFERTVDRWGLSLNATGVYMSSSINGSGYVSPENGFYWALGDGSNFLEVGKSYIFTRSGSGYPYTRAAVRCVKDL